MAQRVAPPRRAPLSKERVLRAAVALADESGIDSLSMRRLAEELDVVPMALYKHVANKEQLLDGMVDVVIGEIDPPVRGAAQELFDDSRSLDPEVRDMLIREMGKQFPHIVEIVKVVYHEADSVVGPGCDDQAEFEFALDLLLDGLEALLQREIQSPAPSPVRGPIHG